MNLDTWIIKRVDSARGNSVLDRLMYAASIFGDDGRGWIAASAIVCSRKKDPTRAFLRHLAWLGIESALVNGPAKAAVRRSRPIPQQSHPHRLRRPSDSSFPSGHAASAATMAMLLSEEGLAPLWWTIALTVTASRVYVGVHYPTDVIGGLVAGSAIGFAARHIRLPLVEPSMESQP